MAEHLMRDRNEFECHACGNRLRKPRILSCLHTFCGECLEQKLRGTDEEEKFVTVDGRLMCPTCLQATKLGSKGISDLLMDNIIMTIMDMVDIQSNQVLCTSCNNHENAVARCCNCTDFLCANCVQAHQNMRCFDNHKVVFFKDIKSNDLSTFHRLRQCAIHPEESLNFYCHQCQEAMCNECVVGEHKLYLHQCTRVKDIGGQLRQELDVLVAACKSKAAHCDREMAKLEASLDDLQLQHDSARSSIEETFHTYRTILEKKKESLLRTLDEVHAQQELSVMDLSHDVEKAKEKMEDACRFTERLVRCGSDLDVVLMRKMCSLQLWTLTRDTPKVDADFGLQFVTQEQPFDKAVDRFFGSIVSKIYEKQESDISSLSPVNTDGHITSSLELSTPLDGATSAMSSLAVSPLPGTGKCVTFPSPGDSQLSGDCGALPLSLASRIVGSSTTVLGDISKMTLVNSAPGSRGQGHGPSMFKQMPIFPAGITVGSSMPSGAVRPALFDMSHVEPVVVSAGLANMSVAVPGFVQQMALGTAQQQQLALSSAQQISVAPNGAPALALPFPIRNPTSKVQPMQIKCKFGQQGPSKSQFNSPHGFCLGIDEDIVVADTMNHRIQIFDKNGEYKANFGIPGRDEGQLWYPRKVTVVRSSGKFVVCDRGNERSRMQLFMRNGQFIKRIAIRYIDIVAGLAVTPNGHIVAVDSVTPTVFCISEAGDLVRWFDCSDYMREPSDIAVYGREYFVCDFKGHCVVVFGETGEFLRRIGCEQVTSFPNGIDISTAGDVLVGDSHGNRFHVAVFQRDGSLLGEFECPHVKVSRCCGLKITSEGYIVTLAKNNHYVLILNTLYISN